MEEVNKTFYIKVLADGPYLVYGNPPIDQEIIEPDEENISWLYEKGIIFDRVPEADGCIALCRCGASKDKPYCDGSHKTAEWDPKETSSMEAFIDEANIYQGPEYTLEDNEKYCIHAQFCMAHGDVWNLVNEKEDKEKEEYLRHAVCHCPSGRLVLRKNSTGEIIDYPFPPSLSIIEQPGLKISGPIWVKGGIKIVDENDKAYEIRNRITLCRCGKSENKPFCDASHIKYNFDDGLPINGTGKKW